MNPRLDRQRLVVPARELSQKRPRRRLLGLAVLALPAGLLLWRSSPQTADQPVALQAPFRTAAWEELVPKEWDPLKRLRALKPDGLREGDPREFALMKEMREMWDNAPTRSDLNGARLRLSGYVVPLEYSRAEIKEFLLVPYFGACVHSPPPPANQIVHVALAAPTPLRMMHAVWVSGTLRTGRQDSPWGMSGYTMEGVAVAPYKPAQP